MGNAMIRKIILTTLAALLLSACATTAPPPDQRHPTDPWEPYNRNMYAFNRSIDKAVIRPVTKGYQAIVPDPLETGISNFFTNLKSLPVVVNLMLQGRPGDSVEMIARFSMNTILGLAGFFDVATKAGLPQFDEDFGQTLAVWGWDESRYFVLPLFGPGTIRDGLGRGVDSYGDLLWREAVDGRWPVLAVDLVQRRADLMSLENQLENAFDEYLFVRDAWLQSRRFKITGESQTPDYDSFLDDDWDEDQP